MLKENSTWLEASDVIQMFPTLVWTFQLKPELCNVIDPAILTALATMRQDLPKLDRGQGWQSDPALHQRKDFSSLMRCVTTAARSILRFWGIGDKAYEITGCWANVLATGAAHKIHSHPNNFHDPRSQTGIIRPPVVELTAENADQTVIRVRNGMLLRFPSYLQHSVDVNTSDRERISISFNIMFSNFTQEMSQPLW